MALFEALHKQGLIKQAKAMTKSIDEISSSVHGLSNEIADKNERAKRSSKKVTKTEKAPEPKVVEQNPINIEEVRFDTYVFEGTPAERDRAKKQTKRNTELATRMTKAVEKIAENTKTKVKQNTKINMGTAAQKQLNDSKNKIDTLNWSFEGIKSKFSGFWKSIVDLSNIVSSFRIFKSLGSWIVKFGIGGALVYGLSKVFEFGYKDFKNVMSSVLTWAKGTGKEWMNYFNNNTKEQMFTDFKEATKNFLIKNTEFLNPTFDWMFKSLGFTGQFKIEKIPLYFAELKKTWEPKLKWIINMSKVGAKRFKYFVEGFVDNSDENWFWGRKIHQGLTWLLTGSIAKMAGLATLFMNGIILPGLQKIMPKKMFNWLFSGSDFTPDNREAYKKAQREVSARDPYTKAKNKMVTAAESGIVLFRVDYKKEGKTFGMITPSVDARERKMHLKAFKLGAGVSWDKFKAMFSSPWTLRLALVKMLHTAKLMKSGMTEDQFNLAVARRVEISAGIAVASKAKDVATWVGDQNNLLDSRSYRHDKIKEYEKQIDDQITGKINLSDAEYLEVTKKLNKVKRMEAKQYKIYRKKHPELSDIEARLQYDKRFTGSMKPTIQEAGKAILNAGKLLVKNATTLDNAVKNLVTGKLSKSVIQTPSITSSAKKVAYAVRVVESSNKYNIAKNHGDGGGVSVGAYQFTSKAGWVKKLTVMAKEVGVPGAAGQLTMFRGNKPGAGYIGWFKKFGNTKEFQSIQDKAFEIFFYNPGKKLAAKYGITNTTMIGHVIDHNHNTGSRAEGVLQNLTDKTIKGISIARKEDYSKIANANPSKRRFLKPWFDRVDKFNRAMGSNIKVPNPSIGDDTISTKTNITESIFRTILGASYDRVVKAIGSVFGISPESSPIRSKGATAASGSPQSVYKGWEGVDPNLKKFFIAFQAQVKAQIGCTIGVNETKRSQARQEWLYASGRTRPGGIVTKTLNSRHKIGKAIDLNVPKQYQKKVRALLKVFVREQGQAYGGLQLLGEWDPFHVQLPRAGGAKSTTSQPTITTQTSSITTPAGAVYIPALGGLIPSGSQAMQLMQQNNKLMGAELNNLRASVDKLNDKQHTAQDGDLIGIIPISDIQ